MAARQIIVPGAMPSRDQNGRALPAKLRFYEPNTALTTLKTVYTTSALNVAHATPILSDAAGRWPEIWADDAQVFDAGWSRMDTDATIATYEDVKPTSDAVLASVALAQASADYIQAVAAQVAYGLSSAMALGTRAAWAAASVPTVFRSTGIRTTGYASIGDGGDALYKYSSTEPSHVGKFQSVDGAWWELSANQDWKPEHFGATGGANDRDAIANMWAAAVAGQRCVYSKLYNVGSSLGTLSKTLEHHSLAGCGFNFTDGAYVGITLDGAGGGAGASRSAFRNLLIKGTNAATPTITLLKLQGQVAYLDIQNLEFSAASTAVEIADGYINKLSGLKFSTCDRYLNMTGVGSTVDNVIENCTFGTSTVGTNPHVTLFGTSTQLLGAYFETESQAKRALLLKTGLQMSRTEALLQNSGGVQVETSVTLTAKLRMRDSYFINGPDKSAIEVAGGSNFTLESGSIIELTTLLASSYGVNASGTVNASGCSFLKFAIGVTAGDGLINGCDIKNCTTGVKYNVNQTVVLGESNAFAGNTTNIDNQSGGTAKIKTRTVGSTAGIADGGTITHGHPKTPGSVRVTPTVAGEFVSVTAIAATNFTVAIKKHDGTAGTAQTLYWEATG